MLVSKVAVNGFRKKLKSVSLLFSLYKLGKDWLKVNNGKKLSFIVSTQLL